jgi:hypothetical protein
MTIDGNITLIIRGLLVAQVKRRKRKCGGKTRHQMRKGDNTKEYIGLVRPLNIRNQKRGKNAAETIKLSVPSRIKEDQ